MQKIFFITTAIDYSNDIVHIGHSYQKILADALARYHRLLGDKTFFLTGTDEHGQKVEKVAKENEKDPKEYVDYIASLDKNEWKSLDISYDRFIRTTDDDHIKFAQEFYLKSKKNGDIYLAKYKGLYCEGCENFLTESELKDGHCPFHPHLNPIKIEEENYFFRLSKYQDFLLKHLEKHPEFVWPESKRNEVITFIKNGLKDFSVSRQGVKWGIPVPDDPKHTIYVWFDALINYLTFGEQKGCWPADVHVLGKDNLRFHAIYWPAMLKSAGYPLPKTILVHDFISLNGQKISKSLGNIIRPSELVNKFGSDAIRYFFLKYGPLTSDVDINLEKIKDVYNSELANGLGNLVSRLSKLGEIAKIEIAEEETNFYEEIKNYLDSFKVNLALEFLWQKISELDLLINQNQLWIKTEEKKNIVISLIKETRKIAFNLSPFTPQSAEKIQSQLAGKIKKNKEPLFPRLS
ncbi:MAG: methionine--tRNA ligase [Patescibacteria group bacterium]|nr:MAG: methionine--tRNA ligase [Patescibacteria group bacterium]